MAYTVVPTVIDGDDLTDDFTLAVKAAIDELKVAVPLFTTTWTPTFTNVTVGNGSSSGRYIVVGPIVVVEVMLTWGSTTAYTSIIGLTLPFACGLHALGSATYLDSGTRNYVGSAQFASSSTVVSFAHSESAGTGVVDATSPFTWTTNDRLNATIVYTR